MPRGDGSFAVTAVRKDMIYPRDLSLGWCYGMVAGSFDS